MFKVLFPCKISSVDVDFKRQKRFASQIAKKKKLYTIKYLIVLIYNRKKYVCYVILFFYEITKDNITFLIFIIQNLNKCFDFIFITHIYYNIHYYTYYTYNILIFSSLILLSSHLLTPTDYLRKLIIY